MTDEILLTAAKLYEQVNENGRMDGSPLLHPHAGLPMSDRDRSVLSFMDDATEGFSSTSLGRVVRSSLSTDAATRAIESGNSAALSYLVGVTAQDLDASALTLPVRLLDRLDNSGALTMLSGAGNPNTGKTNTMAVIAELWKASVDDGLVLSNVRSWDLTDVVTTSAHDLTVNLLEYRDRPKFVVLDEVSTHMDARTKSYEVASQFTPLAKRMSKVGTDVCGVICHTGKDLHPEVKRLTTTAFYKHEQTEVEFFGSWPAESDRPTDTLFGGSLNSLEATSTSYSPDDAAPWSWNLEADLFERDLDWPELLDLLKERGPDE